MQTAAAQITNPLGLDVVWVTDIAPPHEVSDEDHRLQLTEAMERDGWAGAPIVASRELNACGQDRAFTGSHRIVAWKHTEAGDEGEQLPCVFIEDIADLHDIDWDGLIDEYDGDLWQAAAALCWQLPDDVKDAYGLDVDGA